MYTEYVLNLRQSHPVVSFCTNRHTSHTHTTHTIDTSVFLLVEEIPEFLFVMAVGPAGAFFEFHVLYKYYEFSARS